MMKDPVRKAAVVSGLVLTVLGAVILLYNLNILTGGLDRWWPSIIGLAGAFLLYRAFFRKGRPSALFLGLLFTLSGLFILLLNNLPSDGPGIKELWPIFMGIVGVSLIPYGARYRRTVRVTLVVPGIILLVLMGVFLLFSLQIVKQSFSEFVIGWWPMVLVVMGLCLVVSGWAGKKE